MIVNWHRGLGDAIICNGLVRVLATRYDQLSLPIWERNLASIQGMFSDLRNVTYLPHVHDGPIRGSLEIGQNNKDFGRVGSFDQEFYRLAGVDFDCRWSAFKIPECPQIDPPQTPYILVHGQSSEGYSIDPKEIESTLPTVHFEKRRDVPIIGWLRMIAEAEEIHCIESSLLQLVESVPSRGKLFFHAYARRNGSYFQRRKNWTMLT